MSAYTDLDSLLYGTHSFQLLLVLLFSRAQFSKITFTRKIQELTTRSPSTPTQLASLLLDFNGLQILKNITDIKAPFQCNELPLQQVADGIQRGIQLFRLSPRIQAEYLSAMQIVMVRFNGNLRVRPWTILNRVTPLLFSDTVPDADQTAFLAAYAGPTTAAPRPPSDPPSDVPRETALAAAARTTPRDDRQHRHDARRLGTTQEFSPYTDRDRPTAPPHPSSRFRDDESGGTAGSHNVHILEEQVRQLQSQLARLKNQAAGGPSKQNTAYKTTPSEPLLDESQPHEYGLHARTRLSSGSSTVWLGDDFRASSSAGPPPLTFRKDDSHDDSEDYDAQGRGIDYHSH